MERHKGMKWFAIKALDVQWTHISHHQSANHVYNGSFITKHEPVYTWRNSSKIIFSRFSALLFGQNSQKYSKLSKKECLATVCTLVSWPGFMRPPQWLVGGWAPWVVGCGSRQVLSGAACGSIHILREEHICQKMYPGDLPHLPMGAFKLVIWAI